jgi:hypothetical protein
LRDSPTKCSDESFDFLSYFPTEHRRPNCFQFVDTQPGKSY